jgi:DNA repair exonuclease SbcCD ATPase subunit
VGNEASQRKGMGSDENLYFTDEFQSIQAFEPNRRTFEATNNVMEEQQGHEISEFFEEFRRDAILGNEQIQQMTQSFRGAADSMGQIMKRLKASMEENKVLVDTVAKSNKQLTKNNKTLADALKALGGGQAGGIQTSPVTGKKYHYSNPTGEKCPICNRPHAKPFNKKCYELESNKDKRPANWKSTK